MLTISGLKRFYFVPDINDMRCVRPQIASDSKKQTPPANRQWRCIYLHVEKSEDGEDG